MAAFEHPLTDPYLSLIHQSRIQRPDSPDPSTLPSTSMASQRAAAAGVANSGKLAPGSASQNPTTSIVSPNLLGASFEPLSSEEVLERVPSSVVRVLAAFAPAISLTHRFIRLATWTAGPGSGGSSMLLLVSWWLVCAFGYEVIRYAPQAIVLAWISYAWIRKQLSAARPTKTHTRFYEKHDVVSAAKINATLLELSELADFFSVIRRTVLVPTVQLLSWDPSPTHTKAVAAFVLISWPLWLVAFLPWDSLRLPTLVLPVSGSAIFRFWTALAAGTRGRALKALGPQHAAALSSRAAPLLATWESLLTLLARTPLPFLYHSFWSVIAHLRLERFSDFSIRILPPYPIAALSVRSLLCLFGTVALTWCSPWGGLIRQGIWRSATIRRIARGTGRILSGQRPFRDAWGRGKLDDEYADHHLATESLLLRPSTSLPPSAQSQKASSNSRSAVLASGGATTSSGKDAEAGVTRHEDVIYQFSIFENQRWWVGLDWTAALLPQERPSWSDESNNAVSPPSSFGLPPARITLTPAPTASNAKACQRRTVKWQWLDPEWTVAGASHSAFPSTAAASFRGNAREAAVLSAKSTGNADAIAAAKQGYLGDAISRIRSARSLPSGPASPTAAAEKSDSTAAAAARADGAGTTELTSGSGTVFRLDDDEGEWDVDADGWQYGDNAWDKMSKNAGLGRYTRRRKWVRRAVLIEVVERGVEAAPSSAAVGGNRAKKGEEALKGQGSSGGTEEGEGAAPDEAPSESAEEEVRVSGSAALASTSEDGLPTSKDASASELPLTSPASPSLPTSPSARVDLKARLAKAANS